MTAENTEKAEMAEAPSKGKGREGAEASESTHATEEAAKARRPYRVVLGAFALAAVLFLVLFAALEAALPSQSYVGSGRNYGYEYSGAKSSSMAFVRASQPDGAMLVFGSSELSTPTSVVPQVPEAVFGQGRYGLQLSLIGQAFDQSLWHAIAAGAYGADETFPRKVAIIVSPTWFADGGIDDDTFGLRFSYSLYRQFCMNPAISDASKRYLAQRLVEQGIDEDVVRAGMGDDAIAELNNWAYSLVDDLRLRNELRGVREGGLDAPVAEDGSESDVDAALPPDAVEPDFAQLREEALASGEAAATNNDWGYDDDFYSRNIAGREDVLAGTQAQETYSDTPEYEDLAFFLQVCREAGLQPLVIISPVSGPFFDLVGISEDVRAQCYDRIRAICEEQGVPAADFSDKEYERYFLHDIVHFGWTGWADVEEAIYDYARS